MSESMPKIVVLYSCPTDRIYFLPAICLTRYRNVMTGLEREFLEYDACAGAFVYNISADPSEDE